MSENEYCSRCIFKRAELWQEETFICGYVNQFIVGPPEESLACEHFLDEDDAIATLKGLKK